MKNMASQADDVLSVTCTAPVNIAVIKYWGKRNEDLILPINSSLSATLDQSQLRAKTTVATSAAFTEDRMWLNGEQQSLASPRLQNVLREIRGRSCRANSTTWKVHICSENNFPTAAGLASSAAGFACLVFSLAKLYDVEGDISEIARQGSGSACRSVLGGFVAWDMGSEADGSDSLARQIVTESHWPEMRVLILVVSTSKKHIGSTAGMQTTVRTSSLIKHRADHVVPAAMEAMTQAILAKDYQTFAELTMKDSNNMHAVCLDTYPPISYMTDISHCIQRLVHGVNAKYGQNKVCYTYDAGPNACLYLPDENVPMVLGLVQHFFPPDSNGGEFLRGLQCKPSVPTQELLDAIPLSVSPGGIQYIIHTKVGPGPQVLDSSESLLDNKGLPLKYSF